MKVSATDLKLNRTTPISIGLYTAEIRETSRLPDCIIPSSVASLFSQIFKPDIHALSPPVLIC